MRTTTIIRQLLPLALLLVGLSGGCTKDDDPTPPTSEPVFNPDATERSTLDSGAEVVTYDFGDMTLHNYVDALANGVGNSTYVIEGETSLVLIDSQFFEESAADFRAYADGLGKPIDRMLITHGHQDHVRGIAAAFDDVTTYSSQGVIDEALADSGSVIDEVLSDSVEIDGIQYTFEVRANIEASEQVIMRLPDYGVVVLGDVFYNGWHAVMNPGFDNWIQTLDTFAAEEGVNLFLAGHGEAGNAADITAASAYLSTAKEAFAAAADGDEFIAAMLAAYPDYLGEFLLQLSVEQILYPNPNPYNPDGTERVTLESGAEVVVSDFGDMTLHNYVDAPANGVGNSTYVIEGVTSLVLIDSQFFEPSAADFRAYVDGLDKPIDRMLITHGHQDHVRGIAAAFDDVTTYSSQGVIDEALADSGSVIDEVLSDSVEIDGIRYTFEVRANIEASEQVIMRLPDYGVVVLGDVFYNGWHAVMNPGFDNWIQTLDAFAAEEGVNLFLAGHGEAGNAADITAASAYLSTAKEAFAAAADGDEFIAAMLAAYPDYLGEFLLQLSVEQILYPNPFNPDATQRMTLASGAEVIVYDFGDMTLHNYIDALANGVGNSTYVIEGATSLVLIDSQFFQESATDFRAYVDGLDKPIDRMLLTHGHQDHVRGIAAAFDDVTTYSSQGVIDEALADSASVIDEVLGDSVEIDGIRYTFEVRANIEASEQVIMRLPDYGVVVLGDVFYNGWHAVMNPGFDNWIQTLDTFAAEEGVNLFLAGHGEAGDAAAVEVASAYLATARDTFATATDGAEFTAAMLAAYPSYPGAFLLQLSVDQILYSAP